MVRSTDKLSGMTEPMTGRRAQAARNDGRILDAAREVFLADPDAPVAAVAARAGVGISALYRRYDGKDGLLRALAIDGLNRYIADLETALADGGDPWTVYASCLERVVDGGSQALAQRLAGTFTVTPESTSLARRAGRLAAQLYDRTARAGVLRADVTVDDVTLLLEMVAQLELPGAGGGAGLRRRYLAVVLDGLRAGAPSPLPGRPPSPTALARRWRGGPG
jgi:AcrR family transcriptional regulator